MLTVKMTSPNLGKILDNLKNMPGATQKAIVSALNKTGASTMTAASRTIRETYNIKAKDIKDAVEPRKASKSNMVFTIYVKSPKFSLFDFQARQTQPGVTAKLRKGGGRTLYRHTFIATMPESGHTGVFVRTKKMMRKKKKQALKKLSVFSVPDIYKRLDVQNAIEKTVDEKFQTNFAHDLEFYLGKK